MYTTTLWAQGLYTLITAVWPIVDIQSFMQVSGYKTDIWLVKTVAALLVAISAGLLAATRAEQYNIPIIVLALVAAVGLAYVDFYYALNDTIWNIYMADGVIEILFAISWLVILSKNKLRKGAK